MLRQSHLLCYSLKHVGKTLPSVLANAPLQTDVLWDCSSGNDDLVSQLAFRALCFNREMSVTLSREIRMTAPLIGQG